VEKHPDESDVTRATRQVGRRQFLRLMGTGLGAAVLAACGGAAPTTPAGEATSAPAAGAATAAPAAATSAPAAGAATAAPAAAGGKTLRIAYTAEIDTLNAFTSQFLTDIELTMVEGLIVSNDKNEYIPVLATQIPTVENGGIKNLPDGKIEMTWPLQQGVKWHDGTEFTADDVVFTWQFVVSENSEVYNRDQYLPISACEAVDKYTVKMTWDKPYAAYNGLFEAVLPKHVLEGKDVVTFDGYNRSPLGTGPFKFVEWKSGEYVRVQRNPDYWRGEQYPSIDEIVFTFFADDNTRLNALKAGEQDWGQITPVQVKEAEGLAGYKIELVNQNSWQHFDTSVVTERGKKLFSDKSVRQAMAYAIDRQAISDGVMEGTVKLADSVIAPSSPYYNADVPKYPYDVEKAKQLLDAAGWVVGADGIREKDGEKFSFTMMLRAGNTVRQAIAQVIQANLKDVGIEVKFDTQEAAAWTQIWRTGEWEAVVGGWILPADPSVTNLFACEASNNMTGHCDEELDKLMQASDQEFTVEKRKPLLLEVQTRLLDDMFSLPIYYNVTPIVASEKLGNFKPSGTNLGSFWNVYEWTLA
jgi:peptide/nickel transport system substrate-binding protein